MDDTNEDSWLYGTSNPDSTTNESQAEGARLDGTGSVDNQASYKSEAENEAQALAAVQNASSDLMVETKEEQGDYVEYEDPAHEMEEDEEATAAADTTEDAARGGESAGVDGESAQSQQQRATTGSDDDDEDSDDDDINVVIGDIKAASSSYNIKQRGNLLTAGQAGQEKSKTASQGGKFSIEDFEGVGSINGVAAHEFSIDSLEDKPWRKPGADITDYFNYGFNEETWRAYCERQKRFRLTESGVGLASLTQNVNQGERHAEHGGLLPPPNNMMPPGAIMHDPMQGGPGMMPPPMGPHHHVGPIQRMPMRPRQVSSLGNTGTTSKENAIQVMTAECREYSRPGQMTSSFSGPPPNDEPFFPETDAFDYGYEPTQESQWGNNDNPGWVPTGIKELTPGPALAATPQMSGPPGGPPPRPMGPGPMPPGPQMAVPPPIRGPPPMIGNMPPNMGMVPPHVMMMGPVGGPINMPPLGPGGPRMMPPQLAAPPPMGPNKNHPDDRARSPNRRNRSRSPHRSRRRSKSPSLRQRRSRSRSKSHKPRLSRRSASRSRSGRSRRSRSRSGSKSRKTSRTQRSPSESKSRSKRSRKSHSRSRSKSPKTSSSSSSSKKRSEKSEK